MPVKHGQRLELPLSVEIDLRCIEPDCNIGVVPGHMMCIEHLPTISDEKVMERFDVQK